MQMDPINSDPACFCLRYGVSQVWLKTKDGTLPQNKVYNALRIWYDQQSVEMDLGYNNAQSEYSVMNSYKAAMFYFPQLRMQDILAVVSRGDLFPPHSTCFSGKPLDNIMSLSNSPKLKTDDLSRVDSSHQEPSSTYAGSKADVRKY